MRIVAGDYKGRRIVTAAGTTTRPTSDRVREAVFSRLESRDGLADASVLDAFAGSGALGLEALSRGAASATFVENAAPALAALRRNVTDLDLVGRTRIVSANTFGLSKQADLPGAPFSLLFLDPPYRIDRSKVAGLLSELARRGLIGSEALIVWEHDSGEPAAWPEGFESLGERRYGSTAVDVALFAAGGEDE